MQISDILNQFVQQTQANASAAVSNTPLASNINELLLNLKEGQIFEGTIVSIQDGKAVINLADGTNLSARMEQGVMLTKGAAAFFQVKSNVDGQISIKEVSQNVSANPTLLRALASAGVMVNERNLELVKAMMNQKLPIDSNHLVNMVRAANVFSEVPVQYLTQLEKLGVSMNQTNIEQIMHFGMQEGQPHGKLETIMNELPKFIMEGATIQEVADRMKQIMDVFVKEPTMNQEMPETVEGQGERTPVEGSVAGEQPTTEHATAQTADITNQPDTTTQTSTLTQATTQPEPTVSTAQNMAAPSENEVNPVHKAVVENETETEGKHEVLQESAKESGKAATLPLSEGLKQIMKQDLTPTQKMQAFSNMVEHSEVLKQNLKTVLSGKEFRQLLMQTAQEQWFLKPEELANKDSLEKLYTRLDRQMEALQKVMIDSGQQGSEIHKGAAEVKDNLSFVNEVNHLYNYVQVPLKMANQSTTGQLYVYTNKRNLRNPKEELSAHLHLEMEHLGTTDVYVKLRGKKLSTDFRLQDEDTLNFVIDHIDILTQRLQKKGYDVNMQVSAIKPTALPEKQDAAQEFVKEVTGQQLSEVVSRFSFDVKV